MGLFIDVLVDAACATRPDCRECVRCCPVDILARDDSGAIARVVAENEDECILCDLCVERCPVDAVAIAKRYEAP